MRYARPTAILGGGRLFLSLEEFETMSANDQRDCPSPWILFPEICGVSIIGLLLPLPLVHLLLAGHAGLGATGLLVWGAAVGFSVRFIRRRQYGLAYLPMVVIAVLFLVVYKVCA